MQYFINDECHTISMNVETVTTTEKVKINIHDRTLWTPLFIIGLLATVGALLLTQYGFNLGVIVELNPLARYVPLWVLVTAGYIIGAIGCYVLYKIGFPKWVTVILVVNLILSVMDFSWDMFTLIRILR